jgi:hypothetical protein
MGESNRRPVLAERRHRLVWLPATKTSDTAMPILLVMEALVKGVPIVLF